MSKFEVFFATGNEMCVNCAELIPEGDLYSRLMQNRWAKPCICESCLRKLLDMIKKGTILPDKVKKKIMYEEANAGGSGWMGAW